MSETFISLFSLIFTAAIIENMALYYFLGTCPLISISEDLSASFQMGMAVTFVMVITTTINTIIYKYLLVPLQIEYLYLLFFILVIAATTQVLEAVLDRFFPNIYSSFGIFLSLIAVNCAILGASMFAVLREYNFLESSIYALGSGLGWTFVICLMASLRRRIDLKSVPQELGKTGITMIIAAIIALAFSGISELINGGAL